MLREESSLSLALSRLMTPWPPSNESLLLIYGERNTPMCCGVYITSVPECDLMLNLRRAYFLFSVIKGKRAMLMMMVGRVVLPICFFPPSNTFTFSPSNSNFRNETAIKNTEINKEYIREKKTVEKKGHKEEKRCLSCSLSLSITPITDHHHHHHSSSITLLH